MKYVLYIPVLLFMVVLQSKAQNVGIGTNTPNSSAALEINSADKGLLIPRTSTISRNAIAAPPKGLLVYDTTHSAFFYYDGGMWRPMYEKNYDSTTVDYSTTAFSSVNLPSSSVIDIQNNQNNGLIYDNGGPAGNYSNNINSSIDIYTSPGNADIAVKIIVEQMNTETFHDSLFILNVHFGLPVDTIAKLSGTQTGTYTIYPDYKIRITFKSDNAGNLPGFKIRWGRIKPIGSTQLPAPLYGWYFDNAKAAAMGGLQRNNYWNTDSIGFGSFSYGSGNKVSGLHSIALGFNTTASSSSSTALGFNTTASGNNSTAMGIYTTASGGNSTAIGYSTNASGYNSTAIGNQTTASGNSSTTMGASTTASGFYSTAMGFSTIASGDNSTAMGNYVSTSNFSGAFAIGDNSTTTVMNTFEPNAFRARFANGYRLFTNSDCTIGAYLNQNANSWATLSDKRRKEKFEPVNGEYFLQQISAMPLTTWNYIGQDSKTLRHYGPMAQDFFAAFGKDKLGTIGCDTLINQQDFLGVNLIAIQALEKRTQILQKENDEIKNKNKELIKLVQEIRKELDELKGK